MKKITAVVASVLTLTAILSTKADTISLWNFQTPNSTNALLTAGTATSVSGMLADVGTGTASGVHASAAAWSSPAGNGSTNSFSVNTWAIGDYFQFATSTVDYTGIGISFDATRSATGPSTMSLNYSTDGINFTQFGANFIVLTNGGASGLPSWSVTTPNSGYTVSFDLTSVSALDNAANVYFRITDVTAPGGSGGTLRLDNVIISGTPSVPEPSTIAFATLGGLACLVAMRRKH
jgi:hypothetical protein